MRRRGSLLLWLLVAALMVHRYLQASSGVVHGVDLAPVWEATRGVVQGTTIYHGVEFVYLPSTATLLLPIGAFPLSTAADVWAAVSLVALAASCALVNRVFDGPGWLGPVGALVMVGSQPAMGVFVGNVDMVLPLLLAAAVAAVAKGHGQRAALAVGLSVALKPLVVVPYLVLACERRWRALAVAGLLPILLSVPTVLGASGTQAFVTATVPALLQGENDYIQSQSMALASTLRDLPPSVVLVARAAVLVLALLGSRRLWSREAPLALRWAEVVITGQLAFSLISSFAFVHHVAVALLLVPIAAHPAAVARDRWVLGALALLALPKQLPGVHDLQQQSCAAAVLLLIALVRAAGRTSGRGPNGSRVRLRRQAAAAAAAG